VAAINDLAGDILAAYEAYADNTTNDLATDVTAAYEAYADNTTNDLATDVTAAYEAYADNTTNGLATDVTAAYEAYADNTTNDLATDVTAAYETYITNAIASASFTQYENTGIEVVIDQANGNLQGWIVTEASDAAFAGADTNFTETVRLNIVGTDTITWDTTNLLNAGTIELSNAVSVLIFDHPTGTNMWWVYQLR